MLKFSTCRLYGASRILLSGGLLCAMVAAGCAKAVRQHEPKPNPYITSATRHSILLPVAAENEHRAAMLLHLETIQAIVKALVEEDYEWLKVLPVRTLAFSCIGRRWRNKIRPISRLGIMIWP